MTFVVELYVRAILETAGFEKKTFDIHVLTKKGEILSLFLGSNAVPYDLDVTPLNKYYINRVTLTQHKMS